MPSALAGTGLCVHMVPSVDTSTLVGIIYLLALFWCCHSKALVYVSLHPAMSTFSPVRSLSSNGLMMRVLVYSSGIVRNEPICGFANVVHTSRSFRPH